MSRFSSAPDATSLPQEQAVKTKILSKDPAKRRIMHCYFETLGKYLLFTKYLTSTNMPTAQQKKGHKLKKKGIGPTLPSSTALNHFDCAIS